jgi:ATP-binding cassette subfamily B protein
LPKGQLVAFVGASGSGKSTAIQLMLGLLSPDAGRITVGGADLRAISSDAYLSRVSAVFQDSLLFHASIRDNICAGRLDASEADIIRAARSAEIDDWIRSLPEGYDTMVSGDTCSGGQRQRLALARALIRDPELLVLDEPISALDVVTGAAVMRTLRRTAAGRTVLLVTHQLRDAAEASQICVFDQGRVVEIGSHAALVARNGVYATLWRKQNKVVSTADNLR